VPADPAVHPAPPHYYVRSVVLTGTSPHYQLMCEQGGLQTCVAIVPFSGQLADKYSRDPAYRTALQLARTLNAGARALHCRQSASASHSAASANQPGTPATSTLTQPQED